MENKMLKYNGSETDTIDVTVLEKRLEGLRDTQESVQGLSLWCQANRRHSTVIIDTWLKVLRKSPVEKRLTMFYLANDVIQHAKRKSDASVVNQWAFAVQKATPHVRTPSSVSSAITRIFKIWEERSIYSKDAIADLLALLNNISGKEKHAKKPETYTASQEKVSSFNPSILIAKTKQAFRLKSHLGVAFRTKQYANANIEAIKNSIKDRNHGLEVIQELAHLLEQCKASEAKLQAEVEERRKIVENGEIGLIFYENIRGESIIVNSAYKNFTTRILTAKEKVEEKLREFERMENFSPIPSPPPSAPSPPPTGSNDDQSIITIPQSNVSPSSVPLPPNSPSLSTTSSMEYGAGSVIAPPPPTAATQPQTLWSNYPSMFHQQYAAQMQQMSSQYMTGYESAYSMAAPLPPPSGDIRSIPLPPSNPPPLPPAPQPQQPQQPPPENPFYMGSLASGNTSTPTTTTSSQSIFDMPTLEFDYSHSHPAPGSVNASFSSETAEAPAPKENNNAMIYSSNQHNQFTSQSNSSSASHFQNNTDVHNTSISSSTDMLNMSGSSDPGDGNSTSQSESGYIDPMEMFSSALAAQRSTTQQEPKLFSQSGMDAAGYDGQQSSSFTDNIMYGGGGQQNDSYYETGGSVQDDYMDQQYNPMQPAMNMNYNTSNRGMGNRGGMNMNRGFNSSNKQHWRGGGSNMNRGGVATGANRGYVPRGSPRGRGFRGRGGRGRGQF